MYTLVFKTWKLFLFTNYFDVTHVYNVYKDNHKPFTYCSILKKKMNIVQDC